MTCTLSVSSVTQFHLFSDCGFLETWKKKGGGGGGLENRLSNDVSLIVTHLVTKSMIVDAKLTPENHKLEKKKIRTILPVFLMCCLHLKMPLLRGASGNKLCANCADGSHCNASLAKVLVVCSKNVQNIMHNEEGIQRGHINRSHWTGEITWPTCLLCIHSSF